MVCHTMLALSSVWLSQRHCAGLPDDQQQSCVHGRKACLQQSSPEAEGLPDLNTAEDALLGAGVPLVVLNTAGGAYAMYGLVGLRYEVLPRLRYSLSCLVMLV